MKTILALSLFLAVACAPVNGEGSQNPITDTNKLSCLSTADAEKIGREVVGKLSNAEYVKSLMTNEAIEYANAWGLLEDSAFVASKHSAEIELVPAEGLANCIIGLNLAAPLSQREKCDDNGVYGIFYELRLVDDKWRIVSMGGAVNGDGTVCEAFR